jgi:hypothetical protein
VPAVAHGISIRNVRFGEAAGPRVAAVRCAATIRSFRFHKTQGLCLL